MDDITDHDLVQTDFLHGMTLAVDRAGGGNHGQQLCSRVAAARFLYKAQDAGNKDHGEDDRDGQTVEVLGRAAEQRERRKQHVGDRRDQREEEEDCGEEVDEGTGHALRKRLLFLVGDLVCAELCAVRSDGLFVQTAQHGDGLV